jgi:hypothetical protein
MGRRPTKNLQGHEEQTFVLANVEISKLHNQQCLHARWKLDSF